MRFYRYIVYRLYSRGLKDINDTPVTNVVIILSFVHFTQIFSIIMILGHIFHQVDKLLDLIMNSNEIYLAIGLLIFSLLHLPFLYSKKRLNSYIKEFENESPFERKKGTILVYSYLAGCILAFFLLIPILYGW